MDEAVQEILGGGVQGVRLGFHRLIGDGLGPADFVNPHHDRLGRVDGHDAEHDDDEQQAKRPQSDREHP